MAAWSILVTCIFTTVCGRAISGQDLSIKLNGLQIEFEVNVTWSKNIAANASIKDSSGQTSSCILHYSDPVDRTIPEENVTESGNYSLNLNSTDLYNLSRSTVHLMTDNDTKLTDESHESNFTLVCKYVIAVHLNSKDIACNSLAASNNSDTQDQNSFHCNNAADEVTDTAPVKCDPVNPIQPPLTLTENPISADNSINLPGYSSLLPEAPVESNIPMTTPTQIPESTAMTTYPEKTSSTTILPNIPTTRNSMSNNTQLLVPLYMGPTASNGTCTQKDWIKVAASGNASVAILNIHNGPGKNYGPYEKLVFEPCARMLGLSNVQIFGYVHTKTTSFSGGYYTQTGLRPIELVLNDINIWVSRYGQIPGFMGIFIDEVSNTQDVAHTRFGVDHIQFYEKIINYIKKTLSPDLQIIMHSGGPAPVELFVPSKTMPIPADSSIFFEGTTATWNGDCGDLGFGPFCKMHTRHPGIPLFKQLVESHTVTGGAIIYGADEDSALVSIEMAKAAHLKYFYATEVAGNQALWLNLPPYFQKLVERASSN